MMRQIYKYPTDLKRSENGEFTLSTGHNPKVVHFGRDAGMTLCIWIDHEVGPVHDLHVKIIGAGMQYDDTHWQHLDTCQDGPFFWHLLHLRNY